MKLGLQYTNDWHKPYSGVFIESTQANQWVKAIEALEISVFSSSFYIIPSTTPNSVSGLLIITHQQNISNTNHKHRFVYEPYKQVYLLEHTELNMTLGDADLTKHLASKPHFFHPNFGLIELERQLDWSEIFTTNKETFPKVETPKKGVRIPNKITHFSVEIEDEDIEKNLVDDNKEPLDMKNLPFDMKKVLKGNAKEVEKYMAYIEKHPEAALKLGVPLDMLGTSRGQAFAKFKFRSSFWERLGFGDSGSGGFGGFGSLFGNKENNNNNSTGILRLFFWALCFLILIALFSKLFSDKPDPYDPSIVNNELIEALKNSDSIIALDTVRIGEQLDSLKLQKPKPTEPIKDTSKSKISTYSLIFVLASIGSFILWLFILEYRRHQKSKKQEVDLYSLPDDSAVFDFEEPKAIEPGLYFGGNEINLTQKIVLLVIVIIILGFLIYPLLKEGFWNNLFLVIYTWLGLRLLYVLISKHKTFDDEEGK